ncbi:hypothetical protein [Phytoactinopolyspora mesophila]|uniref:Uncharacterized protein n=1 Tax=Phytoactinopolyspora mesophila TaxID=2650750 RepID=A0A7K3M579_9ACTN|nr:hypothetical protein [Phytoactinopolyspora mesophila]NDL58463.1 hypothetical protein [Phytoactinopolyspora mesophila]
MNGFDDQLRNRLNALSGAIDDVHLAGAEAARHRAAQRTRRQVAAVGLSGVVIVALGVLAIGQGQLLTAPEPAHPTQTQSPTAVPTTPDTPDGTADPDRPDRAILTAAFLTTEDITPDGEPGDVLPEWSEVSTAQTPFDCAPTAEDGAEYVAYENTQDGQVGHFLQFIEETGEPVRRFSEIRAGFERCVRDREASAEDTYTGFSQIWNVGGLGDEAWMATYFDAAEEPADEFMETNVVHVQMVRTGNLISVVVNGGPGLDDNVDMDPDFLVTSADRLCGAFGTECVGDVTPERTDRQPIGDIDGWLTLDGVVQATGLDQLVEGSEPMKANDGAGPAGWALTYLPLDPEDDGATFFQRRFYQSADPGYLGVDQEIAVFPDDDTARAHYEDLIAAAAAYNEGGREVDNTGSVDEGDRAITTWRESDEEYGISFVFGIAVRDNAVTVVNHGIDSAAGHDVTADQMMDLLSRAADRLTTS